MPELPEVETTLRALRERLPERRITAAVAHRANLRFPLPVGLDRRLVGRTVIDLRRRAKFMLIDLDDGHSVLLHLGMSGRLRFDGTAETKHEHVTLTFDDGSVLRFIDPRRFGILDHVPTASLVEHKLLAHLGLEPLATEFTGPALHNALSGTRSPLKVALMDQRRVVGVGNIYASESLHRAGLAPTRPAQSLREDEAARLVPAVQHVLNAAIQAGGSSLRDYVQTSGELGYFQHHFTVYDRAGLACLRCGTVIERLVQANRATFHCPKCQS